MERITKTPLSIASILEQGGSVVRILRIVLAGDGTPEQEELALRKVDPKFVLAVATAMGKSDAKFNGAERGAVEAEGTGAVCPYCQTVIGPDQVHQVTMTGIRPTCAVFHNKWLGDSKEAQHARKQELLWRQTTMDAFWSLFEASGLVVHPDSMQVRVNAKTLADLGWTLTLENGGGQ